jgi:hypothetical protein
MVPYVPVSVVVVVIAIVVVVKIIVIVVIASWPCVHIPVFAVIISIRNGRTTVRAR